VDPRFNGNVHRPVDHDAQEISRIRGHRSIDLSGVEHTQAAEQRLPLSVEAGNVFPGPGSLTEPLGLASNGGLELKLDMG
jgi:hypothetical protein